MKHTEILAEASRLIDERGKDYGDLNANFERVRMIFFAITGINLTSREAAIFLVALKLARLKESPEKTDHYTDGINYLAFAGQFADEGE
jgi:hypothetical protein